MSILAPKITAVFGLLASRIKRGGLAGRGRGPGCIHTAGSGAGRRAASCPSWPCGPWRGGKPPLPRCTELYSASVACLSALRAGRRPCRLLFAALTCRPGLRLNRGSRFTQRSSTTAHRLRRWRWWMLLWLRVLPRYVSGPWLSGRFAPSSLRSKSSARTGPLCSYAASRRTPYPESSSCRSVLDTWRCLRADPAPASEAVRVRAHSLLMRSLASCPCRTSSTWAAAGAAAFVGAPPCGAPLLCRAVLPAVPCRILINQEAEEAFGLLLINSARWQEGLRAFYY